ncbi:ATP-binding protein [Candidatus Palauibacter sp.]|uniref:ATP-binding protein n=1 Tax=Candidatus Palauibacter sp. TaxID=3101350 RepID=UPI003B5C431E
MEATFKTRARTLDMLGRQQIAGIPTAISELFKNAHDAYATRVEVDYFRSDGLFVLRDNGFGMTRDEFLERWLTIAAAKNPRDGTGHLPRPAPGQPSRPVLGEKGIGRLAIATIAPQVLVLTRAQRGGELSDLTAAFLNWRIFECAGLNLQDIRIPIRTFPGGQLPDGEDIADMVDAFRSSNARLQKHVDIGDWEPIEEALSRFTIDPRQIDSSLGEPSLTGSGHGTRFCLLPASERLPYDIDGDPDSNDASPLEKALLGFTTPFLEKQGTPVIQTAFRDHKADGTCDDPIGEQEFFTRSEYENADHQIAGRFDEHGQFKGSISVYGEVVDGHVINWRGGRGRPTACGPFFIRFAAIEGAARHSTLPDHTRMLEKTRRIGGLYIYRDGVRIQPYGNTDYDWLEIELRRTKSASYYYFSYRQMFGFVEIDSRNNGQLQEKAGREGFQENKAYRELRSILKSFLVQVAADFFREEGVHGERFANRKRELSEEERHKRVRAKKVTAKRAKLRRDLRAFYEKIHNENPLEAIVRLGSDAEASLREASQDPDRDGAAHKILRIERDTTMKLVELEARYRVPKPRIGMSRALQEEWREYQEAFEDIRSSIRTIRDSFQGIVTEEVFKAGVDVTVRDRLEAALDDAARRARKQTRDGRKTVEETVSEIFVHAHEMARRCVADVESAIRDVLAEFSQIDPANFDEANLVAERATLEGRIQEALENASKALDSLRSQLTEIDVTGRSSLVDQLAAVEQSNVTLQEQARADLQLAQLGMAIEIISHEFGTAIRSVRSGLRSLKAWADVNEELMSLYQSIRGSFDHLDGYLTLFTPLQRRLYRKAVDIRGWEIHEFLTSLFGQRLARHNIELVRTDDFAEAAVRGYPSSFYPVFVNLVDNAIYWLSGQNERLERRIELDVAGNVFRVSDSGPGIHARDREDIFEIGFTRKPGGRGMGLHISRQTLREVRYDLTLADRTADRGTTFLIGPLQTTDTESDAEQ